MSTEIQFFCIMCLCVYVIAKKFVLMFWEAFASFSRCRQIELITSRWEWLAAALMALSLNFHLRPKVVKTFFLLFLSGDTDSNAKRFWQTLEFDKNYFAAFDNNFWGHLIDKFMRRISSLLWTLAGKYF